MSGAGQPCPITAHLFDQSPCSHALPDSSRNDARRKHRVCRRTGVLEILTLRHASRAVETQASLLTLSQLLTHRDCERSHAVQANVTKKAHLPRLLADTRRADREMLHLHITREASHKPPHGCEQTCCGRSLMLNRFRDSWLTVSGCISDLMHAVRADCTA